MSVLDGVVDAFDMFDVFLSSGYGASCRKLEYGLSQKRGDRAFRKIECEQERRLRERYFNMLLKLKRDGLIYEVRRNKRKRLFRITRKGRIKLALLSRVITALPSLVFYKKEKGERVVIVVFDIPEKERVKRDWLRRVLQEMSFSMIQRSVWMGKVKLPKNFFDDLLSLKIVQYVEIFEVTKEGTLRHVV